MKKLKLISMILAVIMVVSMLPLGMVSAFAAGPSDENDPTIGTAAEFVEFMNNWIGTEGYYDGKTVKLTADIDLTGVELPKLYKESAEPWDDGTFSNIPVEKIENTFTGIFDGQNHTISGYAIVNSRSDGFMCVRKSDSATVAYNINDTYGLFGRTLAGEATIKNVTLNGVLGKDYAGQPKSGAVVNAADVGALYGWIDGTLTVENVTVNGITSGSRSAGFVYGVRAEGEATFTNCEMGGKVLNHWTQAAADGVGGFVGRNQGTVTITNCLMSGYVAEMRLNTTGGSTRMIHMGGFTGYNSGTLTIQNSIVSGTVISHSTTLENKDDDITDTTRAGVAGFVGQSVGTLTVYDSMVHQFATVETKDATGGVMGQAPGYYTAGFVGLASGTVDLQDCAMYGTVTTPKYLGGIFTGRLDTKTNTVKGLVAQGTYSFGGRTYLNYGGQNGDGQFNITNKSSFSGTFAPYATNTKYTNGSGVKMPYCVTAANLYTLDKLEAAVAGLLTYEAGSDDATAWATEVANVKAWYQANWTFSGSALPVPNGCVTLYNSMMANVTIDSYGDLMTFAAQLNAGNTFAGKTVKMTADVVVNDGWDAFATTVTAPATVWPLGANKAFAGTFDGQGHTISGIYMAAPAEYVGIFGNVATGTTATVKNIAIENSYVTGDGQGLGGLFGFVNSAASKQTTDVATIEKTKAVIDNVYADINVVNTEATDTHKTHGTGGLIGGVRSNAVITNTAFVGSVNGGTVRGVGALIGAVATNATSNVPYYLHTITIQNCYLDADLTQTALSGKQSTIGAIAGYVTYATTTIDADNVISNCTMTKAGEGTNHNAYLVGATHKTEAGDTTRYEALGTEGTDYLTLKFNNVTYVATEGSASKPVANGGGKVNDTITKFTAFSDDDWASNGVKKVATVADLPKVLYAQNVSGMSVTLTDDLAVNLYADMKNAILNNASTLTDVTVTEVNGEYKFTYSDILPQEIGDDVLVNLGAASKTVNVKDYLAALLDDAKAQDVAADLLRYGAAAQIKANYKTTELVTADLETKLEGLGTTVVVGEIQASAPNVANKGTIAGMALRLENSLAMIAGDENQTVIATTPVMASQMDETLKLDAGDGSYVECSVAWYVKAALSGGVTNDVDLALIEAIYAYGLSAKAYAKA